MTKTPIWYRLRQRCGQAVVLLLAVLMVMVALVFWMIDTHGAVLARLKAQDAGDPVALAAARWQAAGLNLCGELNLIHAYMLADDVANLEAAAALHELQQRITLVVPVLALQAAQVVAQRNDAQPLPEAREFLRDCSHWVQFPDFYEGATEDFRAALEVVLRDEIYAYPISPVFPESDSLLGNQDFYEAVLAEDYCWFWFNAYSFLESYRDHHDFGRVPEISTTLFFDFSVSTRYRSLSELRSDGSAAEQTPATVEQMNDQLRALGHPDIPPPPPPSHNGMNGADTVRWIEEHTLQPWMVYGSLWHPWEQMRHSELPIRAEVKPEFDVFGAYTAVTVAKNDFPWMAGAKPFGSVGGEPPRTGDLLLGGFDAVRLVPVDGLEAGLRPFEPAWYRHLYFHVRGYSQNGQTIDGCRYCRALHKWDTTTFRVTASTWLTLHGHTCRRPKPGRSETGGSTYAH